MQRFAHPLLDGVAGLTLTCMKAGVWGPELVDIGNRQPNCIQVMVRGLNAFNVNKSVCDCCSSLICHHSGSWMFTQDCVNV